MSRTPRSPVPGGPIDEPVEDADRADDVPLLRPLHVYLVAALSIAVLGMNWPIMSVGVGVMDALWLSTYRLIGGGLLVGIGLAATGRLAMPARRDYPVLASVTIVRLAMTSGLLFAALQFVPPGRSSVLVYTAVLWMPPLARWLLGEHSTWLTLAGVVVGGFGVIVLVAPWSLDWSDGTLVLGHAMLLGAALAQAVGSLHVRGHRWSVPPIRLMPWQLVGAGLIVGTAALIFEGAPPLEVEPLGWVIVAYQIVAASAFGFYGVLTVTRNLPAVSSQLLLMAIPAVGVLGSVVFLDERLTLTAVGGMVLIFAGVATSLVADARRARRT